MGRAERRKGATHEPLADNSGTGSPPTEVHNAGPEACRACRTVRCACHACPNQRAISHQQHMQ